MILSSFELASAEIRKAAEQRAAQQRAREPLTPQHAACEAAVGEHGDERARERARRVQHDADPVGEVAAPDLDKVFRDAYLPPADWPQPGRVSSEDFRRGPITAGQGALSPGHEPPSSFPLMPSPQMSPAGWSLAAPPTPGPYVGGGDCR